MPTPKSGESMADWMHRCMPVQLSEGKKQTQAAAICMSMFRKQSQKSADKFGEITKDIGETTEIKADGQKRTVEAYASTFGNVDEVGDRVMPGAFTKSIKESFPKGSILVCLNHDKSRPIGVPVHMEQDSKGLYTKSRIARTPLGDEALALIEDKVCTRFSIRAGIIKAIPAEDHDRFGKITNLHELRLTEYGPVYWAANEEAQILSLKNLEDELYATLLGVPGRVATLKAALDDATAQDRLEFAGLVDALTRAANELAALVRAEEPTPPPPETPESEATVVTPPLDPEAVLALQSEIQMFRLKLATL